jgi:hypothetical protein
MSESAIQFRNFCRKSDQHFREQIRQKEMKCWSENLNKLKQIQIYEINIKCESIENDAFNDCMDSNDQDIDDLLGSEDEVKTEAAITQNEKQETEEIVTKSLEESGFNFIHLN